MGKNYFNGLSITQEMLELDVHPTFLDSFADQIEQRQRPGFGEISNRNS